MEKLFNLLFPSKCFVCSRYGAGFCPACISKEIILGTPKLEKVSNLSLYYIFEYKSSVRECIRRSKYKRKEFSVLKDLCRYGFKLCKLDFGDYTVVPIPAHVSKLKYRGFNQADLIAKEFGKVFNLRVDEHALVRTVETHAQFEISRQDRFKNLEDAFLAVKNVTGMSFVLIDDVCTTGATFVNAAKVLQLSGAKDVVCFALSRSISKL